MNDTRRIPFSRPALRGRELAYIRECLDSGCIAADGPFTKRVEAALEAHLGAPRVLLTPSCTAALELAALLTVEPGDEVIVPSFTYATTASAFARCGAMPVFVDIRPDTLNIDPSAVAAAITPRTKAIVAVHYAGIGCDLDALKKIAGAHGLALVEDAAQEFGATYQDRPLGTLGNLGALSFDSSKNVTSGEGGALIVNDPGIISRAEIIRDRGTNRVQFLRKEIDQYSWTELGSAYAPSEIVAAFLLAQVEDADAITAERRRLWTRYHKAFEDLERRGRARRPVVPAATQPNGHIYYLLAADAAARRSLIAELDCRGIDARFHFVPLHSAPAGRRYGRTAGLLATTEDIAKRIVRLPLYAGMEDSEQDAVIQAAIQSLTA